MLRRRDEQAIRDMVSALPDAFREAIVLREINDLSYREIADIVGVPVGTVMSRLARGRSMLRAAWLPPRRRHMMTCDEAKVLLHALLDGELDAGHAREVEAHIAGCPRCAAELAQFREMRDAMSGANLRFAAPAALRSRIEASVAGGAVAAAAPSRRSLLQGFAFGTALSAIAATGVVFMVVRSDQDERMLGDVVSAHLRSLQAEHLTDVRSTDQHAVKPWFSGKVAVAPPVMDLTAQGFTLLGGRLDAIDGKPVAAIVYRRGEHVINLFVAAAASTGHTAAQGEAVQGFNTQRWSDQGMRFIAISDLSDDELRDFHVKFEAALRAGRLSYQRGVVNRVVPSRSMRGSRSTSQDRYSFIASVVLPARS